MFCNADTDSNKGRQGNKNDFQIILQSAETEELTRQHAAIGKAAKADQIII